MAELSQGKIKMITLLEILNRETDEEHPLSATELCFLLETRGFPSERKALYRNIAALKECGADIINTRTPKPGFFLGSRNFDLPEIRVLLDAVLTAPFITQKKTAELTVKLCGQLSKYQTDEVTRQFYIDQRIKFENEEIYYSIDVINKAISERKKIVFQYYHRTISGLKFSVDQGKEFILSPYALIWTHDKYYLAGNYEKYDTVGNYRIDRMKKVRITEEPIRPFQEVSGYKDQFDVADYQKKMFNMFSGMPQYIEVCCDNSMIDTILDKFGEEIDVLCHTPQTFTIRANVYCSGGLVEWLLQYGGRIKVLSPKSLQEMMIREINILNNIYIT